jgi:ABC-type uncharacterized transport system permease subunit
MSTRMSGTSRTFFSMSSRGRGFLCVIILMTSMVRPFLDLLSCFPLVEEVDRHQVVVEELVAPS